MEEKNSDASKNNDLDSNYPEELREDGEAALTLITMRYSKVDKRTSIVLGRMDKEFLGESGANPDGENHNENSIHEVKGYLPVSESFEAALKTGLKPKVPLFGQPIDGLSPPKFPPIKNLQGLIGRCGKPFEKQLTESDVKPTQSRLSIPRDLVQMFVKPLMNDEEKDIARGISVMVYDSKGREHPMEFKTWVNNTIHVLIVGWKKFCNDNKLEALQDWVTIWAFRHNRTQQLCFAIMARRFPIKEMLTVPKSPKKPTKKKRGEMERRDDSLIFQSKC